MSSYYHTGGRFRGGRGGSRGRGCGGGDRPSHCNDYYDVQDASVFRIRRAQEYDGATPLLEQPQVMGCYSVDEDKNFGHDRSLLKFIESEYLPRDGKIQVHLDMNEGFDKIERYSGSGEDSFLNLLKWILSNQDTLLDFNAAPPRLDVNFICLRQCLTKIMRSPYHFRETWSIMAKIFQGTIYLVHHKSEGEVEARQNMGAIAQKASVWGHKFEHIMMGGDPNEGVRTNAEFRCVLRTKLGDLSIMYAPEVDGADPEIFEEDFKDLHAFVTVKCCGELSPRKMDGFRRFKLSQWWMENKLSGIPEIVVGFRNDDGVVHTLESYRTDDLPQLAQGAWSTSVSINFLNTFLGYIKKTVEADPTVVHRFDRESANVIHHTTIQDSNSSNETPGASRGMGVHFNIIPSWYRDQMFPPEDAKGAEKDKE